ncbi:polyketide cyclase / dehydrase and lipid transport domain containing protein [Nitzschia inconspicua]|uniref:Polyketide cyclase / dehydrase and lipid transport domain containing protein n=1 Tax=Nitzschia inconspicua TaxID=303405 RepID=A0A9K3PMF2_9STRA|nr:polyketide cyclase / dehydrase and lipid transport domain containing protein [Nitzschia inconspicua]
MIFSGKSAVASFLKVSPVTKRHGESRILKTHPLHLFRIIQDVDRYHEFLPLCHLSKVYTETIVDNGRQFEAKLRVGKPPLFSEEYISRVTVVPEHLRVCSESISSQGNMFESLKSSWQLRRVDTTTTTTTTTVTNIRACDSDENDKHDTVKQRTMNDRASPPILGRENEWKSNISCHVDFQVEMTVTDPVVVGILDTVLLQVAGRQVEAFEKRCEELPWPDELIEQIEGQRRE